MTYEEFIADKTGVHYIELAKDQAFLKFLDFINLPERRRRMAESVIDHDRPPLAGIIKDLELQSWFRDYMENHTPKEQLRFKQGIGVVVRMVMESYGFRSEGIASIGAPSQWFKKALKYTSKYDSKWVEFPTEDR